MSTQGVARLSAASLLDSPALWGLAGAVVFAGPKLTACIYNATETKVPYSRCVLETITALIIGVISAAAFEPWLAGIVHMTTPPDQRALSTVIGIAANPTAPGIISFLSDVILTRIKGGH